MRGKLASLTSCIASTQSVASKLASKFDKVQVMLLASGGGRIQFASENACGLAEVYGVVGDLRSVWHSLRETNRRPSPQVPHAHSLDFALASASGSLAHSRVRCCCVPRPFSCESSLPLTRINATTTTTTATPDATRAKNAALWASATTSPRARAAAATAAIAPSDRAPHTRALHRNNNSSTQAAWR